MGVMHYSLKTKCRDSKHILKLSKSIVACSIVMHVLNGKKKVHEIISIQPIYNENTNRMNFEVIKIVVINKKNI